MSIMKRFFLIVFAFLCLPVFADFNEMNLPDSTEIRKAIAESWFYGDLKSIRQKYSEVRMNAIAEPFQVRMEETEGSFAIIVAPQVKLKMDFYTEDGVEQKIVDEYPGDAFGSWILSRNSLTGEGEWIRIYFSVNSEMYIQFAPNGNITLADFVIAGLYAAKGVPIGIPFEQLYTASFREILQATEKILPWKYADLKLGQFGSKLQMIGVIRKNLNRIHYSPASCYDENGELVDIFSGERRKVESKDFLELDSAGFLKWIADGLVEPVAGSHLYVKPLLVQTVEYEKIGLQAKLNQSLPLSFTLDWCRNLAAACLSIRSSRHYLWNDSHADVKIEPFSAEVTSQGITQTVGYIKDSGYEVEKLKPLLYVLASTEPTYCYLAAVKRPAKTSGNLPLEYFVFDECAVIFPYYDKNGHFECAIFENGKELSLSQFVNKYKGCFVNLSRLLTENSFFPD